MVSGLTHRGQYQSYALLCSLAQRSTLVIPLTSHKQSTITYTLTLVMTRLINLPTISASAGSGLQGLKCLLQHSLPS